jgi:type VI secretion system protein ImpC
MPASLQFEFNPTPRQRPRDSGGPLRILLLGDFSGRPAAERAPLAGRPTMRVDLDSIDTVLRRLAPRVSVGGTEVDFEELEDFHPDALLQHVPVFDRLRQTRQRLQNPATFAQAAAELGMAPPAPAGAAPAGAGGDLLAGLLGGKPAGAGAAAPTPAAGIDAFVRNIAGASSVPDTTAQKAQLVATVDAAIAAEMRGLLHDGAFQSLEAAWRGVQWLVQGLELDDALQLHLFDVTRDELLADVVAAGGRLAETGLHRALADRWRNVPGGEGWSLLTGLYTFGPGDTDIGLLAALGLLASQAGGPLVASGHPSLALAEPAALAGWQALRGSEAAPWLGLAAPRVLLRLPYGKRSDPVSAFAFEEFAGAPEHGHFLWGAGSLAVAMLIGRAFMARGWEMEPGDEREIGDLPAYTFERDGESDMQACAEQYLGEEAGLALLAAGLMPVLSHRNRNAVTVMRMQSIAEPPQALAGLTARR